MREANGRTRQTPGKLRDALERPAVVPKWLGRAEDETGGKYSAIARSAEISKLMGGDSHTEPNANLSKHCSQKCFLGGAGIVTDARSAPRRLG